MSSTVEIKWLTDPEDHDYPAALSYLSLLYDERTAGSHVAKLRSASISQFKAKDLLRASGLSVLDQSNAHIEKDKQKILTGTPLSPLLLVRDSANGRVIVADGYHRLCAVYAYDENAAVPCKIA